MSPASSPWCRGAGHGRHGRIRVTPTTWDSLVDMWAQLAFWASSLIFLLAAMLVPRLLTDVTWDDVLLLAILVPATLVARAIVVYGLMPLLSISRMAARASSNAYKLVIVWGGLRGAVSLALALAVSREPGLPDDVRHFVAVLATGFVLFTLLVNGMTLRPLLRLGLDRLSEGGSRRARPRHHAVARRDPEQISEVAAVRPHPAARDGAHLRGLHQRIAEARRTADADAIAERCRSPADRPHHAGDSRARAAPRSASRNGSSRARACRS